MFGGFTTRPNFGNQLFPSRVLGQFGNVSSPIAGNFLAATGITDPTISAAINQLVIDLSNYGILSKFYAIYPFVGNTATQQKFNLINPADTNTAYRLNFVGGWTHSTNGALGNGTNSYADTFFLNSLYSATNHSYGIYSRTNNISDGVSISAEDGSFIGYSLALKANDNNTFFSSADFILNGSGNFVSDTRGLFCVNRISNTEKIMYRNGVNIRTSAFATTTFTPYKVFIGARNIANIPQQYDSRQFAFAYMSEGFTPTQAANLYTAVQAFQTTLGRQV
jgi:hypothetical protein